MIKGLGYLKYLKQSLIGFGISCFILLGGSFVNGVGAYTTVGIDSSSSAVNSNYNITFLKGGGLLTNYIGQGKGILALDNSILFWRLPDGLPYFYSNVRSVQGYFPKFYVCSPLSSGGNYQEPTNCTENSIDEGTVPLLKNFFSSVKAGDVVYYNYSNYGGSTWRYGFKICWDSSEIGNSMCFDTMYNYNHNASVQGKQLINSRGYTNLSFASLPYSEIGNGPGQLGNINGGSYTGEYNGMTGDTVSLGCTKKQALEWYRCNGYKSRMCYSSFNNNDELYTAPGEAVGYALTGVDIEDVRFNTAWYRRGGITGDSMDYNVWFSYWRNIFDVYKKNENITNPFVGVPVSIFTLMGNVNSYGLPYSNESILEFCDLSLYTADYNSNYTGIASSVVCNMSPIEITDCHISNMNNPDGGLPGDGYTDGTVSAIGSSWEGITNRSGFNTKPGGKQLSLIGDGKTFENNFFTLLKDSFKYPETTGTGFIPGYILIVLCGLVLFRFLSH